MEIQTSKSLRKANLCSKWGQRPKHSFNPRWNKRPLLIQAASSAMETSYQIESLCMNNSVFLLLSKRKPSVIRQRLPKLPLRKWMMRIWRSRSLLATWKWFKADLPCSLDNAAGRSWSLTFRKTGWNPCGNSLSLNWTMDPYPAPKAWAVIPLIETATRAKRWIRRLG